MNWEAIGAIGETLGAVGVIVTLIYLATQLRQNTRALNLNAEFAAAQEHMTNSIDISGTDAPYVVVRGFEDPTQLDAKESAQFLFWLNGSMRMYQHQHLMFLKNNFSPESWSSTVQLIRAFAQTKGFQAYWHNRKNTYTQSFQDFVDTLEPTGVTSTLDALESMRGEK